MAVFKPTDSRNWWISIYRPGGKRKYIPTGTSDKQIALAMEAQVKSAMCGNLSRARLIASIDALMGWDSDQTGLPISTTWETYMLTKPRAGADTINRRQRIIKKLMGWTPEYAPQVKRIHEMTPQVAQAFVDWLEQTHGGSGKTQNNRIGNLSTVFSAITVRAGMDSNPFQYVQRADESDSTSGRAFTHKEAERLLTACTEAGKHWHEISLIALYSGLRLIDIANLTWDRVSEDSLDITPSKTKRHKIRVRVPLHPKVKSALDPIRKESGPVFEWLFDWYQLPGKNSTRYPDIIEKAGIKPNGAKLTFHCWRHTFRTRLAAADVPQEIAMKLGGWTNESTAEIYNHDFTQMQSAINALR